MASPTAIAAYLILFTLIGAVFLFINLFVGRLVRPNDPHAEKKEIYECGEPAIGSSFVQFDLRFYVVALVFIVFDAEVAFLFPAATVFGKQTQLADVRMPLFTDVKSDGKTEDPEPSTSADAVLASAARGIWPHAKLPEPPHESAEAEPHPATGLPDLQTPNSWPRGSKQ